MSRAATIEIAVEAVCALDAMDSAAEAAIAAVFDRPLPSVPGLADWNDLCDHYGCAQLFALAPALARAVIELRAIIEGRTTGPTDAELAAHDLVGGSWRVVTHAVGSPILAADGQRDMATWSHAELRRDAQLPGGYLHGADTRWWAVDWHGRPCAWPGAETLEVQS